MYITHGIHLQFNILKPFYALHTYLNMLSILGGSIPWEFVRISLDVLPEELSAECRR